MRLPPFGWTLMAAFSLVPFANGARAQHPVNGQVLNYEVRIESYLALRRKVADGLERVGEIRDLEKHRSTQRSLAASIRRARPDALQGDIFTSAIVSQFRDLLKPEIDRSGIAEEMTEEKPMFELRVNAEYPEAQPLTSVPPTVLRALPRLPKGEGLEYRFVRRHLILLDTRANLVVDFALNALP